MDSNLGANWELSGAIMGGLVLFGIAYAMFVHSLGCRKEGYTWLLVVVGNAVTVLAGATIDATALDILVLFACSGAPMAGASIYEYIVKREQDTRNREHALARILGEMADDGD